MKFSRIALLSAASIAVAQPHHHVHRHMHGSPLVARDGSATTTTVSGPIVTVYELNGQVIPWDEVEAGIKSGKYVLTGDQITSVLTPTSTSTTPTSTPSSTSSSTPAAVFLEQKTSSSTSTTPTSTYVAPTTSTAAASTPTSSTAKASSSSAASAASDSSSSSSSSSSTTGLTATFPNGTIDCTDFDTLTQYGAVSASYLGLGGYTGIQITPHYTVGASSISYIETGTSGSTCTKNSFCSYQCPAGYQKSQYPSAQGSTGQSIGGLYCNSAGKLELSRSSYTTLCQKGVGSVQAKSSLSKVVAVCRTDYPGTESETVGVEVSSGSSTAITCPDANTYFKWKGMSTTAQYYINPSGYTREEACLWGESGTDIGNWAPVNMGLGRDTSGDIYMSLFPNSPTNPDGVLDFNIKITGAVSGTCTYVDGKYYSNGVESSSGCTIGVTGDAYLEFY